MRILTGGHRPPWPPEEGGAHHGGMNDQRRIPVPAPRALTRADIAGQFESLDGRRAVLSALEGSRYDRRAVGELYASGGAWWLDVATERDWYAAMLTGAPLQRIPWPAGAVWVE